MAKELKDMRESYEKGSLTKDTMHPQPLEQFTQWLEEAKSNNILEANAFILSTASIDGVPSSRTVLLKEIDEGLIFYTNYKSDKAKNLMANPKASFLFLWKEMERQVRISGRIEMVSREQSEAYFQVRPRKSQLGAWASNQSSVINSRKVLEDQMEALLTNYPEGTAIPTPPHWGGFRLIADTFEFWQGRKSRLHDRIKYQKIDGDWVLSRLSP